MKLSFIGMVLCLAGVPLVHGAENAAAEPLADVVQLTGGFARAGEAYFSPDGKQIIFASSLEGHRSYELFMMNLDGSNKTRITYVGGVNILPVFSADGNWLMWTSKRGKDHTPQVFAARFTPRDR